MKEVGGVKRTTFLPTDSAVQVSARTFVTSGSSICQENALLFWQKVLEIDCIEKSEI